MRGLTAALGVAGLVLLSWTYPGALVLLAIVAYGLVNPGTPPLTRDRHDVR